MKLLELNIQDGENNYAEYIITDNTEEANDITSDYVNNMGFMRAIRNKHIRDISSSEIKVLTKFGIV